MENEIYANLSSNNLQALIRYIMNDNFLKISQSNEIKFANPMDDLIMLSSFNSALMHYSTQSKSSLRSIRTKLFMSSRRVDMMKSTAQPHVALCSSLKSQ